jgi:hypothetical protein
MNATGAEARTSGGLRDRRSIDFYFAFGFALLTLVLQTCALVAEVTRASQSKVLVVPTLPYIFLIIELCLAVNVVGLWLRKAAGLAMSLFALAGVGAGYFLWYVYSRQVLTLLSSKSFYQIHPEAISTYRLDLIGATWLNVIVLVMAGVLFIWEVKSVHSAKPTCV